MEFYQTLPASFRVGGAGYARLFAGGSEVHRVKLLTIVLCNYVSIPGFLDTQNGKLHAKD